MSDLKLLDGVKVVDMSAFVAAPMAAEILAEYGADVEMCIRDRFKRFFSSFTLPKTSALFASFLNTRRVAYSSANYGDASATKLFIFLS